MAEITIEEVRNFLEPMQGQKITLDELRDEFNILKGTKSYPAMRVIASRLCEQKVLKRLSSRKEFRVLQKIEPVNWWDDEIDTEPINFLWPQSHEDHSEFGFEEILEVFPGDMVLIAGASNYGKTTLALNLLGENLGLMPSVLMGSEYTAADGKISPKFKRRMGRMSWVNWVEDGKPRFQLYPIGADYEDYVQSGFLNYIDWISLPGEYYMIDAVMKAIKDRVGEGMGIAVIQKNPGSEYGEGGPRTERYADVYLTVDPYGVSESMVTIGKVKAPKGKATGRTWAFEIVDYGANLLNIREIVKCNVCYGKKWKGPSNNKTPCDACNRTGYVDK